MYVCICVLLSVWAYKYKLGWLRGCMSESEFTMYVTFHLLSKERIHDLSNF